MAMEIEKALRIAETSVEKVVRHGGLSEAEAQPYLDQFSLATAVELVFDISVRAMVRGLQNLISRAEAHLLELESRKDWATVEKAKGLWLRGSIADAKKLLVETGLKSDLPDVGQVFVAQRMTDEDRFKFQDMILDLEEIASYGICSTPGCFQGADWSQEYNGFHRVCGKCHKARIEADRKALQAAPARCWVNNGKSYETVEVTSVKTTTAVVEKREASKKAEELRKGLQEAQEAKKNKKSGRTSRESDESRSGSYRVR